MEIWKDIHGFEGVYQVSSLGRVKSLPRDKSYKETTRRVPEKILMGSLQGDKVKYLVVVLYKNGIRFKRKKHHLVLEAFQGERPVGYVARHLDDKPLRTLTEEDVIGVFEDPRPQRSIAEDYGTNQATVHKIKAGKAYCNIVDRLRRQRGKY